MNSIGIRERMRPSLIDRPRGTGDYLFMFFYDPVCLKEDGEEVVHPARTLVVWEPGEAQYYGHPALAYTHSWMHCEGRAVKRVLAGADLPRNRAVSLPHPDLVEKGLEAIYEEMTAHARADPAILRGLLEIWVRRIGRAARGEDRHDAPPARLLEVRRFIERRFREPLSLEELAKRAHVSVPHLCAEFKRHFGTPAIEYAIRLRLQEAAHLLGDRNLGVGEIARRVGYEDIYYFSRLFKKHYGASPTALRREMMK